MVTSEAWTQITLASQYGSCWMSRETANNKGKADVRIVHTDSGSDPADAELLKGKKLFIPNSNNDTCSIAADNSNDVFFAKCVNDGDQAVILVDVRNP